MIHSPVLETSCRTEQEQYRAAVLEAVSRLILDAHSYNSVVPSPLYNNVLDTLSRTTVLNGPSVQDIKEAAALVLQMQQDYNRAYIASRKTK